MAPSCARCKKASPRWLAGDGRRPDGSTAGREQASLGSARPCSIGSSRRPSACRSEGCRGPAGAPSVKGSCSKPCHVRAGAPAASCSGPESAGEASSTTSRPLPALTALASATRTLGRGLGRKTMPETPWCGYFCLGHPQEESDTPELERAGWEARRPSEAFLLRRYPARDVPAGVRCAWLCPGRAHPIAAPGRRRGRGLRSAALPRAAQVAWTRLGDAGWRVRQTPARHSVTGRIGRGAKPPPQLGHTLWSTPSAHSAQNVHS